MTKIAFYQSQDCVSRAEDLAFGGLVLFGSISWPCAYCRAVLIAPRRITDTILYQSLDRTLSSLRRKRLAFGSTVVLVDRVTELYKNPATY
mmetsp:Transcript_9660/g.20489  ORF Transcript_9660/g.20489 Transcript_9660/m.20489 type:complete len:91 (+) Transcript_9660:2505-2777(+)